MATQTRNPTSDEAASGTLSGVAGTRYTLVSDHPDSSGLTALTFGTAAAAVTFGFSAFTVPAGSTSISVQVLYYDSEASNGANNCAGRLKAGGTYYNASTHNPSGATYTSRTDNWATNPKTAQAWTVDDVNGIGAGALQAFGIGSTDSNPAFRVASVLLQVTYTEVVARTGSGGGAASSQTGSGSGFAIASGVGAGTANTQTATGSAGASVVGSGGGTVSAQTGTGSGTVGDAQVTGSGAGAATAQTGAGACTTSVSGSGTAAAPAPTGSGAGAALVGGTGSSSSSAQTASGSGTAITAGAGSGSAAAQIGSGAGTVEQPAPGAIAGSGAGASVTQTGSGTGSIAIACVGAASSSTQIGSGTATTAGSSATAATVLDDCEYGWISLTRDESMEDVAARVSALIGDATDAVAVELRESIASGYLGRHEDVPMERVNAWMRARLG